MPDSTPDHFFYAVDPCDRAMAVLLAWGEAHGLAAITVVQDESHTLDAVHEGAGRIDDEFPLADLRPYLMAMDEVLAELGHCQRWTTPSSVFETHPTSPVPGDVAVGLPGGCWRTVDDTGGYRPCNAPVDDDLGLCSRHAAELRSTV